LSIYQQQQHSFESSHHQFTNSFQTAAFFPSARCYVVTSITHSFFFFHHLNYNLFLITSFCNIIEEKEGREIACLIEKGVFWAQRQRNNNNSHDTMASNLASSYGEASKPTGIFVVTRTKVILFLTLIAT